MGFPGRESDSSSGAFAGTARFRIIEPIGEGGMGVVYRAFDERRGTQVALKVLRKTNPNALYRFKQEFRSLAGVSHPNLLPLYELATEGQDWFFTMELVDGVDFVSYVRGHASRSASSIDTAAYVGPAPEANALPATNTTAAVEPVDDVDIGIPTAPSGRRIGPAMSAPRAFARLRDAVRQLADGVRALHAAGHLHRDLKPSNVMVDSSGRVVVLDFGVILTRTEADREGDRVVGTPSYMAPEQAAGGALTEASDWYAVGTMMYEAITGRRPYGGDITAMLNAKRVLDPTPITDLAPDAPHDLVELCGALMGRAPRSRPGGEEVLRSLGRDVLDLTDTRTTTTDSAVALIGRERHLGILRDAFDEVEAGRQRAVAVHGRSGMGKSALLDRFLDELRRSSDAMLMTGRCYERESVPYKAVDALVDELARILSSLEPEVAEALVPASSGALARLFPVLRTVPAILAAPPAPPDPHEVRRRAVGALRDLLTGLAELAPVVIHIDDAQWGDVDSAHLLVEVLSPPAPPPVLLLLAYRSEDASVSAFLRTLLRWNIGTHAVEVEPLTLDQTRLLARTMLGYDSDDAAAQAEQIAEESDGNPMFVTQLAVHVGRRARATARQRSDDEERSSTVRLDEMLQTLYDGLPDKARRLLAAVAVAGRPTPRKAISRAAGVDGDEEAAMQLMRNSRLIRARRSGSREFVEPYHDRVREAIVAHLEPTRLRDVHIGLGRALQEIPATDPETLATHFERGGERVESGHYYAVAAGAAWRALAFEKAAQLYQRAANLGDWERAQRVELFTALADVLTASGRGRKAADAYLAAAADAEGDHAVNLRFRAAEELLKSGYLDDGLSLFRTVTEEMGMPLPRSRPAAIARYLVQRARVRVRRDRYRLREPQDVSAVLAQRADLCWSAVVAMSVIDTVTSVEFVCRGYVYAMQSGDPSRVARAILTEAIHVGLAGPAKAARRNRLLHEGRRLAEIVRDPSIDALVHSAETFAFFQAAEFRKALRAGQAAGAMYREHTAGAFWETTTAGLFSAWSQYHMGELPSVVHSAKVGAREAEERGDLYAATAWKIGVLCCRWLCADDPATAREVREQAMEPWASREGFNFQEYWAMVGDVMVLLYEGDGAGAWRLLSDLRPRLARSQLLRVCVVNAETQYLRVCAALASGGEPGAARVAAKAARVLRRHTTVFGRGLGALATGILATRRGDLAKANDRLIEAAASLDSAECALQANVARRLRGVLIGGDEGGEIVAATDAWFRSRGVVRPERFAEMLAPGAGGYS
jgi:serine/threonine protein kinase